MKKLILSLLVLMSIIIFEPSYAQTVKSFQHGGLTRQYIEYVPASYNGSEPYALVICLHGLGDNMTNFSSIGMHLMGDTGKFITLYPQAMASPYGTAWNSGASYMGMVLNPTIDDVGFLTALMDTLSVDYNIDQTRIFVTGFSMGGFMTNRMACEKGDRVAAIASVAGTIGTSLSCNPIRPIPVFHIHGTADGTVGYTGNLYGMDAQELVDYWVSFNACDTAIHDTLPDIAADGYTVESFLYLNGDHNSKVLHYKINGADHTWLIPVANDISYAIEIWNFFSPFHHPSLSIEQQNQPCLRIFPNPASDKIFISLPNNNMEPVAIRLTNLQGQEVYATNGTDDLIEINISSLNAGIYILYCNGDSFDYAEKIIIQ